MESSRSTRGVQQADVSAAANALVAERLRPTIERVRMKIGRGSPNTIAPMLEAWFASLAPRLGLAEDSAEEGMPAAVRLAAEEFWRKALAASHEAISGEMAKAKADLVLSRRDLDGEMHGSKRNVKSATSARF